MGLVRNPGFGDFVGQGVQLSDSDLRALYALVLAAREQEIRLEEANKAAEALNSPSTIAADLQPVVPHKDSPVAVPNSLGK